VLWQAAGLALVAGAIMIFDGIYGLVTGGDPGCPARGSSASFVQRQHRALHHPLRVKRRAPAPAIVNR
jgi:hypothetical protein